MCGYSQGWCDPSTETDCYKDGSPRTSGVTSGDVMFGEVGACEPSTTNCPINNLAVDVTAMGAMS
ncbi:hypothetical protein F2Q70_00017528 [Brassica cretica]|uniref:Uncharacterized protein n=1 Tax=Brassica cretica TaxID=69181 RepID=A0A8S9HVJ0_BRACR|nr:hypothetical protein F2Q70_00017528 [Brassica cretica]